MSKMSGSNPELGKWVGLEGDSIVSLYYNHTLGLEG